MLTITLLSWCLHRFAIDKIDEDQVFSINLGVELCIDATCEFVTVFDGVQIPIPGCNIDYNALVLPGDGSVAGFVQELGNTIGDSAISVVLEKLGLAVRMSEYEYSSLFINMLISP